MIRSFIYVFDISQRYQSMIENSIDKSISIDKIS